MLPLFLLNLSPGSSPYSRSGAGKIDNREEFYFNPAAAPPGTKEGIQHLMCQMLNARWQMADITLR